MNCVCLITPEIGRSKGGIQNWMFYVRALLFKNDFFVRTYAYREDNAIKVLPALFRSNIYFLATWKMSIVVFPFVFFSRKKVFIFVHGDEILCLNVFLKYFLFRLTRRKGTYFIANSKATSILFRKVTGLSVDFIQVPFMELPAKRVDDISGSDKNIFLTVTRLVKRKNIQNVVSALKELDSKGFEFVYYIAGDGPELNNLVKLVERVGLEEKIIFLGRVSEGDKQQLYDKAGFFLLPSIYDSSEGSIEGYGIVFIEANLNGIPVLSGNTGGMVEAVIDGETGLHCDGSIQGIQEGIIKLSQTNFQKKYILSHAEKHDYLKQVDFIQFIKGCLA